MIIIDVSPKQLLPHHSGEDYGVYRRKLSYIEVASK